MTLSLSLYALHSSRKLYAMRRSRSPRGPRRGALLPVECTQCNGRLFQADMDTGILYCECGHPKLLQPSWCIRRLTPLLPEWLASMLFGWWIAHANEHQ